MFKITPKTNRSSLCELHAKSICSQLISCCTSFESLTNSFIQEMEALPRVNTSHCSDWYKLIEKGDVLELWHLNVYSDPDRLVLSIKDDGVPYVDPFNF